MTRAKTREGKKKAKLPNRCAWCGRYISEGQEILEDQAGAREQEEGRDIRWRVWGTCKECNPRVTKKEK